MKYIFLNNTVQDYLISAAIIIAVIIIRRIISKFLAGLISKLLTRKNKAFNKTRFHHLVLVPIETFLVILTVVIAGERLNMPEIFRFNIWRANFAGVLEGISILALIVSFIWLGIRLVEFIADILHEKAQLTHDRADDQLIIFFKDLLKVLLGIVGLLLIIKYSFHQPLSQVLTGISIVGAALALAFRESLENLIASFIIFFDKPFTTGDLVKVQNVTGTVERIGLRSTRIRTTDKTFVTVPNKQMVDSILDNQSLRTQRNVLTKLQLHLETTTQQIQSVITDIQSLITHHEYVIDSTIFFSETGVNAHIITVAYFVTVDISVPGFNKVQEDINLGLIEILARHGARLAAAPPIP